MHSKSNKRFRKEMVKQIKLAIKLDMTLINFIAAYGDLWRQSCAHRYRSDSDTSIDN